MERPARGPRPVSTEALPDLALARAVVDRSADRRADDAWLTRTYDLAGTRVLRLSGDTVAVLGDPPVLDLGVRPDDAPPERRFFLGLDDEGTAYFAVTLDAPDGGTYRGLRQIGAAARRPRRRPRRARRVPGELARDAHPLPALRLADPAGGRRSPAPLRRRRQRALPAHRPGSDHGGRRRRRPAAAGPAGHLAGGQVLDAGRVRRAGGVAGVGRPPRGRRGGRPAGRPGRPTSAASRGRSRRA